MVDKLALSQQDHRQSYHSLHQIVKAHFSTVTDGSLKLDNASVDIRPSRGENG